MKRKRSEFSNFRWWVRMKCHVNSSINVLLKHNLQNYILDKLIKLKRVFSCYHESRTYKTKLAIFWTNNHNWISHNEFILLQLNVSFYHWTALSFMMYVCLWMEDTQKSWLSPLLQPENFLRVTLKPHLRVCSLKDE